MIRLQEQQPEDCVLTQNLGQAHNMSQAAASLCCAYKPAVHTEPLPVA